MRPLFALMTLFALLLAPLAAPAAAMAVAPTETECGAATMGGHEMPASHHRDGAPCCIAVPPAIDPPVAVVTGMGAADHLAFVALIEPFWLGAGPHAEDPPPRIA